jgi:hypothetical protein
LRYNRRFGPKRSVAAGVVAVPVRIQNEFQFALTESFQRCLDLVGQWRKLIINDENPSVPTETLMLRPHPAACRYCRIFVALISTFENPAAARP